MSEYRRRIEMYSLRQEEINNTRRHSRRINCVTSRLELYSINKEYKYAETLCLICLTEFVENDLIRILKCNHKYCYKCINTWLAHKRSCAICKCVV